ncbi:MAG TPA: sulfite exporter TauE/SafE family protein [Alphaproteobacteria bacterium]|nr:sulfite exporter TauE/SafE family protein [Alphaproteobacteria bacterium]
MEYLFVLAVGLVAGTVSGIVGTGSSIMLVPVLVYAFGPKEAVPIMAVAALMGNVSRVMAWWREVDWRACAAYAVSGMPAAALGAKTLLVLPARIVDLAIGCFLIAMVPTWRFLSASNFNLKLWHLTILGAGIGYLTGIVVSTGPLSVPLFLAYGLLKGAFIATEAAASLGVYIGKTLAFREFGALPVAVILKGLIAGSALMGGSFVAKHFMVRLTPQHFRLLMDGLLLAAGASMLWAAW